MPSARRQRGTHTAEWQSVTDREDDEESTTNSDAAAVPIWLTATLDDARAADFESPILTSPTADCATLNATYNEALNALDG